MSERTFDATKLTLAEAEEMARAKQYVNLRYPDRWEMMIWYAPGANATVMNGGIGYLWRQLKVITTKSGKTQERVDKSSSRGVLDDKRGWVTRAEATYFHESHQESTT